MEARVCKHLLAPGLCSGTFLAVLLGCASAARAVEPPALPERWTNWVGMEFVRIPAGEFTMGTNEGEPGSRPEERPAHKVRITHPFLMGKHEVTVEQYHKMIYCIGGLTEAEKTGGPNVYIMGDVWEPRADRSCRSPGFEQTDRHPVTCVTWNDAQRFIKWLNRFGARPEGTAYRLPTEAEWEYAASGPKRFVYPWGNEFDPKCANFSDAQSKLPWAKRDQDDGFARTAPVGSFSPAGDSPFGLADLGGNVWEWCEDWFDKDYYKTSPAEDPVNLKPATERVERGGSWAFTPDRCRVAFRFKTEPGKGFDNLGFRVVLVPVKK